MTRLKQGLKRQAMAEHTTSSDAKQARLASGATAAPSSLVLSEDEEERLGSLSSFNAWKRKVERARGASACIKVDRVVRSCGGFNERYEPLRFVSSHASLSDCDYPLLTRTSHPLAARRRNLRSDTSSSLSRRTSRSSRSHVCRASTRKLSLCPVRLWRNAGSLAIARHRRGNRRVSRTTRGTKGTLERRTLAGGH